MCTWEYFFFHPSYSRDHDLNTVLTLEPGFNPPKRTSQNVLTFAGAMHVSVLSARAHAGTSGCWCVPVCHLLAVPAEGVVGCGGLPAAQRLPEAAVEGAEAPQAGYELPEAVEREKFNLKRWRAELL